jgi:hypothetical protein
MKDRMTNKHAPWNEMVSKAGGNKDLAMAGWYQGQLNEVLKAEANGEKEVEVWDWKMDGPRKEETGKAKQRMQMMANIYQQSGHAERLGVESLDEGTIGGAAKYKGQEYATTDEAIMAAATDQGEVKGGEKPQWMALRQQQVANTSAEATGQQTHQATAKTYEQQMKAEVQQAEAKAHNAGQVVTEAGIHSGTILGVNAARIQAKQKLEGAMGTALHNKDINYSIVNGSVLASYKGVPAPQASTTSTATANVVSLASNSAEEAQFAADDHRQSQNLNSTMVALAASQRPEGTSLMPSSSRGGGAGPSNVRGQAHETNPAFLQAQKENFRTAIV